MNRVEPNRNVYVGHRYVPLLVGEWDKSIQYEGLSIVTYKGESYTSKKMTPAGIDIKNEEFWVLTGNYDAQVEYYRLETERVKEYMEELDDRLTKDLSDTRAYVDDEVRKNREYVDTSVQDLTIYVNDETVSTRQYVDDEIYNYKKDTDEHINNLNDEINSNRSDLEQTNQELSNTKNTVNYLNNPLKTRNIRIEAHYPLQNEGAKGDIWIVVEDKDNLLPITNDGWEQGTLSGATGDEQESTIRIRNIGFINIDVDSVDVLFDFENELHSRGIHGKIFQYDSNDEFIVGTDWGRTGQTISIESNTESIRATFAYVGGGDIFPEDIVYIRPSLRVI